jgi:hypothetical protein
MFVKDADSEELIKAAHRVSIGTAVYAWIIAAGSIEGIKSSIRLAADVGRQRSDTFAPYVDRKRSLQTVLSFGEGTW